MLFDRKCVGGGDDRCGSGLLDGGGAIHLVASAKRFALVDAVFEVVTRQRGVDLARLERWRAVGSALDGGQAQRLQRKDYREAEIEKLHVDFSRRVAVGALVGRIEPRAELLPVVEGRQGDRHRVLLAEVTEVDRTAQDRRAGAR